MAQEITDCIRAFSEGQHAEILELSILKIGDDFSIASLGGNGNLSSFKSYFKTASSGGGSFILT